LTRSPKGAAAMRTSVDDWLVDLVSWGCRVWTCNAFFLRFSCAATIFYVHQKLMVMLIVGLMGTKTGIIPDHTLV
jgi:hypothetical protein